MLQVHLKKNKDTAFMYKTGAGEWNVMNMFS